MKVLDRGFCEVAHMVEAQVKVAQKYGADAVTVCPYTGWDAIYPFLEAGLMVFVKKPKWLVTDEQFRRIMRVWQQMARRKYGKGKLLTWKGVKT